MCLDRLLNKIFGYDKEQPLKEPLIEPNKYYYTTPQIRKQLLIKQMKYYKKNV